MNYIQEETADVREFLWNYKEDLIEFQLKHDVQIIRGEDYQYMCYINKECYSTGLTTLGSLVYGYKKYKETKENEKD